ncbi:MAG: hypothetical protein KAV00_03220 [Phycisphaerae bacterium]|nr:hypothetical protein [Phycisphaerae bacterium]
MMNKSKIFKTVVLLAVIVVIGPAAAIVLHSQLSGRPATQPQQPTTETSCVPSLKPAGTIIALSRQQKEMLLGLPLSRNYDRLSPQLVGLREKLDANGVVMVDYSKYGQGWDYNPEAVGRYAIRALTTFLESDDERYLALFQNKCDWLVSNLKQSKHGLWQWFYKFDYIVNNVYDLKKPWASAMAQGTAIAALARAHYLTGSQK